MQIAPVDVARHARYRAFRARLYIDAGYAIGAATLSWVAWQPVGVDDLRCHGKASHGRRNGKNRQRQRKIPVRKKKQKKSGTLSHPRIFENDKFCVRERAVSGRGWAAHMACGARPAALKQVIGKGWPDRPRRRPYRTGLTINLRHNRGNWADLFTSKYK
jgi:hypothetical protein